MLDEVHRRQTHGFLIPVQAHCTEPPEAHGGTRGHDKCEQHHSATVGAALRVAGLEQRGKLVKHDRAP